LTAGCPRPSVSAISFIVSPFMALVSGFFRKKARKIYQNRKILFDKIYRIR
jgi:hypothetical protein